MRNARFGLADLKRHRALARDAAASPAPAAAKPKAAVPGSGGTNTPAGGRSHGRTAVSAQGKPPATTPAVPLLGEATTGLDAADTSLFRQAVRYVAPLKSPNRYVLPPIPQASPEELRHRRAKASGDTTTASAPLSRDFTPASVDLDASRFLRVGLGPDVMRDLRRGRWPIIATLDLHGATQDAAWERLSSFVQSCLAHQVRGVRIVHGKGLGSRDGTPVLKQVVRRWLAQLDAVLAYTECTERDGGDGAVHVLLRLQPGDQSTPE